MDELTGSDHILMLPSAPSYMTLMKTIKGKPEGQPIWISFIHKEEFSLSNKNISTTLISLSKILADLATEETGKVVHLTLEGKTYNIYIPGLETFQISFVIVFEDNDHILVELKHRDELVFLIVKELEELKPLVDYLPMNEDEITMDDPLYREIQDAIARTILAWDKKRVKYLRDKLEEERKRIAKIAKQEMK
ncbi:MAG: hypothetical protein INQ03_11215 [Candidatus Heimdallarchaeota archaeon]|nr:hypothetical protein [Candidatus Heimdallarchaeota archaeon]